MGFLGRPNPEDERRAEEWRDWLQGQHPLAIASFVLGVISIIEFGVLLVFGFAGIALGGVALAQIRRGAKGKKRLAWAGIGLSALSLVMAGIVYSLPPAG